MVFIDDLVAGYSVARTQAELMGQCRQQGEEFLRGRGRNSKGEDVYAVLKKIYSLKVEAGWDVDWQMRTGISKPSRPGIKTGYAVYIVLHPWQSYQNECDRNDIIISEVRAI